jgi:diacylglycerol kinase family enzyme
VQGVDLVLNPHARRLHAGAIRRRILLDEAARHGARVHEPTTIAELDAVARDLASRRVRVVVLAGGDGTLMRGLTALARAFEPGSLPSVAVVPAGTVGTVARNLGLARVAVRRIFRGACSPSSEGVLQATLQVRDGCGAERVGFIFGAGMVAHFFDVYHRSTRPNLVTAAVIAGRTFAGSLLGSRFAERVLAAVQCEIAIDGLRRTEKAWSLVVASVVRDLGLHFQVTYRAGRLTDRFHVVASGLAPLALGRQMPRVLAGRPLRGEPRVDALAKSVRLDFERAGDSYVLDGDVFQAPWVTVETGPAVRILTPC